MTDAGAVYGQSMYELARGEGLEDRILEELLAVRDIFGQEPDYVTLLSEPSIPRATRVGLVDEAFGGSVHEYVASFIKVLLEKGLLRSYPSCVRRYETSYNADHGITEAIVTSAVDISDEEEKRLKDKLTAISGKKVVITRREDPSVLGGIKVELDGRLLDGTVAGRLSDLRRQVTETAL